VNKKFRNKLIKIGSTTIGLTLICFYIWMFLIYEKPYKQRFNKLNELNYITNGAIESVEKITTGRQSALGGYAEFGGYQVEYSFTYNGEEYNGEEYIPDEKIFNNILEYCSELKELDEIEIIFDSLNPNKSLMNIK